MKSKQTKDIGVSIWEIIRLILIIHLILFVFFVMMSVIMNDKGGIEMELAKDIFISVISSVISAIGVSVFIYYKYLKHIPTETKNKIDDLLNSRLNYETVNHNAAINAIDGSRKELQNLLQPDNRTIYDKVDAIHLQVVAKKDKQDDVYDNLFNSGQRAIINAVSSLSDFADVMVDMQEQNHELRAENEKLRDKVHMQQRDIKRKNRNYQFDFDR